MRTQGSSKNTFRGTKARLSNSWGNIRNSRQEFNREIRKMIENAKGKKL
ncbi:MAG: hypothetical protein ABSB94_19540 [Syntrophorhabdales bacterium]|jgi:hypothetical protein